MLEVEQHALAFRQLLAEHQAALAFGVIDRKLDGEGVDARRADDLDGILCGRLRRREQDEKDIKAGEKSGGETQRRRPGRRKASGARCYWDACG
jgi:hypothetical protein